MPARTVVELRVHGVGGPTPASVLDTVDPKPVGGAADELAGIYTRDEPGPSGQRLEAFVWGGLTSKTKAQAAWWLLLPFSLLNVAGWMIRPGRGAGPGGHEKPRSLVWWIRLLVVFAGILLTAVYVLWLSVALLDLVAYQCGAQADCVDRAWLLPLRWFHGHPLWRIALGGFAVAAVTLGVLFAARLTHRRYEEYEPDVRRRRDLPELPEARGVLERNDNLRHPGFWYNWQGWRRLYLVHALAAITILALVVGHAVAVASAADDLTGLDSWGWALGFSIGLAVIGLLLAIRAVRPPPVLDSGPDPRYRLRWLVRGIAVLVLAGAGYVGGGPLLDRLVFRELLDGGLGLATIIGWAFVGSLVLLTPGLVVLAVNAPGSFRWGRALSATPRVGDGFRWFAPAVVVVAAFAMTGAGFGAAVVRLADFLDGTGEAVAFHTDRGAFESVPGLAVDLFLAGLVLAVALLLLALGRSRFSRGYADGVVADYPALEESLRARSFVRRVARARLLSQVGRTIDLFLTGLMVGIVAAAAIVLVRVFGLGHEVAAVTRPLLGFGGPGEEITDAVRHTLSWAILLFIFPGALLLRAGARSQGTRRQVGKVWDSITFFPRRFHPLGAPCYAERAVPMLREHIRELTAAGEPVLIHAHSQGTVLSLAALAQLAGEERPQVELVVAEAESLPPQESYAEAVQTAAEERRVGREVTTQVAYLTVGSPLGKLHAPFFPDYFDLGLFTATRSDLEGRWVNYYRETDYIGKCLFVDPDADLDLHGRLVGDGSPGGRPGPPDHSLLDPVAAFDRLELHVGYHRHPAVVDAVSRFVAELREDGGRAPGPR